ncbi:biotin-dependent carboxyltransferase family protein [Shouchella clausii]|uniref:5-oxoprolinase subunit C family protein n=1 Tax=Shouchella clausii TaxID=79880 RepID=UPI000BA5CD7B|nr:biotin-dependent carboxyltransferase family protein [Shouchella clausii]PAD92393.1 hypothetical protein CHH52_10435 [Shouchella clausii]
MSISILKGGLLTTVQDLGRKGYLHQGVVEGGAMDRLALRSANLAVGNEEGAACLEMTLLGPAILFKQASLICVAGKGMTPYIEGKPYPLGAAISVPAGQELTFKTARQGARAYLAIAGGIDVPAVLGSRSTYLRAKLGGFEGRKLEKGDLLPIGKVAEHLAPLLKKADRQGCPLVSNWHVNGSLSDSATLSETVVRAIPGSHFSMFTEESQTNVFDMSFTIQNNSDRMGYSLQGEAPLLRETKEELLSEAVTFGTVQVPPDGEPIVLMADRQSTGGYPRMLQVAAVDLPKLAQMRPGDTFSFKKITLEEAQYFYLQQELAMQQRKVGIALKRAEWLAQ